MGNTEIKGLKKSIEKVGSSKDARKLDKKKIEDNMRKVCSSLQSNNLSRLTPEESATLVGTFLESDPLRAVKRMGQIRRDKQFDFEKPSHLSTAWRDLLGSFLHCFWYF